ncbi:MULTISPECIES: metallophosphoesterase [Aerococcus]|uniref:metallophosphoesterase n=1 Tax=Aerococcus TaxID=1375 RepID=UPI000DCB9F2E|nr:metallophosphoesterase [Aerococcus urinae]MDK7302949.1 metallophosphoesterase [Aerococcus urinae]RAV71517.1 metallophosphoesterase [Aerococcus urinae]RAW05126.1 metallophosphoesterase [Aerococcus urinae]
MKILLISDSHGDSQILSDLVARYQDQVDLMLHCGDSELDPSDSIWNVIEPVKGNCDFGPYKAERIIDTPEGRLIYTHGHLYGVKAGVEKYAEYAKKQGCQIAVYGHTHIMDDQVLDGVHLINPGSVSFPRGNYLTPTYAILDWQADQEKVTFYQRNGEKVPEKFLP